MPNLPSALPIEGVLDRITHTLAACHSAVLVAPPGAGKTTRVPLALRHARWLNHNRIIVLEPRRLAARSAAEHMARLLGEPIGQTVGLRARLATQVGPATRIEVVTEGVFTRMILEDPALDGIGVVLFDEFHERSMDADFGLALALDAQRGLREDLRLLVMSATLDHVAVADLLGAAPVIKCEGRSFPVATEYLRRPPGARIEDHMTAAITRALVAEHGSVLAFLPGQAEIGRVAQQLGHALADQAIDVVPLYGRLDLATQARAIAPAPAGQRKVVLATDIAETSLTIDGVRIVIDAGLARTSRFEPGSGLSQLTTVKVSRASADQRRGRAGRTEPGVCYRLWSEPETKSLRAYGEPQIMQADLSALVLDCAAWGVNDPRSLDWLDLPPSAAIAAARDALMDVGALEADGRLTGLGRKIAKLPLPPRLALMLLRSAERGQARHAADVAAVLVERGLGGLDPDLELRVSGYRADPSRRAKDMRSMAQRWARMATAEIDASVGGEPLSTAAMLSLAYPDRLARSAGAPGRYLLAAGRAARLPEGDPLQRSQYLAVAEITGTAAGGRITLAAALSEAELELVAADRIKKSVAQHFDAATGTVRRQMQRRLGAIVLATTTAPQPRDESAAQLLWDGILQTGLRSLPWSEGLLHLRERTTFLAAHKGGPYPDLSDAALGRASSHWLLPFLVGKVAISEIETRDLQAALDALLPRHIRNLVEREAPGEFAAPSGTRCRIDYASTAAPKVSIRVQDVFGLKRHPTIADGAFPLTLELLSPANRPIQITRDLPGFWAGSWAEVRAQLRGRYPRHAWPEDPAEAVATSRAKPKPQRR